MKSIRISSTYIMSLDGVYVDKCSLVDNDHLSSLIDSLAMFFTCLYVDTKNAKYYHIFKYLDTVPRFIGKLDASDICASIHYLLQQCDESELSLPHMKLVLL